MAKPQEILGHALARSVVQICLRFLSNSAIDTFHKIAVCCNFDTSCCAAFSASSFQQCAVKSSGSRVRKRIVFAVRRYEPTVGHSGMTIAKAGVE